MPGKRRGRQFKLSAARLVLEEEIPAKGLSDRPNVPCRVLGRRAAEYGVESEDAFPGSGNPAANKDCDRSSTTFSLGSKSYPPVTWANPDSPGATMVR